MVDQHLDYRLTQLQTDMTHVRCELAKLIQREEQAKGDREFNRALAIDGVCMFLQTVALLALLAHGFRWL
jgi:hypothetical protein